LITKCDINLQLPAPFAHIRVSNFNLSFHRTPRLPTHMFSQPTWHHWCHSSGTRWSEFVPWPGPMGYLLVKRQCSVLPPSTDISPFSCHSTERNLSGTGILGQLVAVVPCGLSPTPRQNRFINKSIRHPIKTDKE
jgi:hypothetical protein